MDFVVSETWFCPAAVLYAVSEITEQNQVRNTEDKYRCFRYSKRKFPHREVCL